MIDAQARVRRITKAILNMPVLPTVTSKILEVIDEPKASASILANVVNKDQGLTAKVLRVANSPFYGLSREVQTVQHAIVVLGFNGLRDVALGMSVFNLFKKDLNSPFFDPGQFWQHCLAVALGAQLLSRSRKLAHTTLAFTAGLLHDMGKMVCHEYFPMEEGMIWEQVNLGQLSLPEAEIKVLGVTHEVVGSWLADHWKLPKPLVQAIQFHHRPMEAESETGLCALVYAGDYLAKKTGFGPKPNKAEPKEEVMNYLSLTPESLEDSSKELEASFRVKASDLLSEI